MRRILSGMIISIHSMEDRFEVRHRFYDRSIVLSLPLGVILLFSWAGDVNPLSFESVFTSPIVYALLGTCFHFLVKQNSVCIPREGNVLFKDRSIFFTRSNSIQVEGMKLEIKEGRIFDLMNYYTGFIAMLRIYNHTDICAGESPQKTSLVESLAPLEKIIQERNLKGTG